MRDNSALGTAGAKEDMTFSKTNNPRTEKMAAAKAKMIALVAEGMPAQKAMVQIGYKEDTLRIWMMRDKKFARDLEAAKDDAKNKSTQALGVAKDEISFPKFSEVFLDQKVFPHHQDWIDLLEGREPSWLHPSMTFEPGDQNRLLLNVPP